MRVPADIVRAVVLLGVPVGVCAAQQQADPSYRVTLPSPSTYASGTGPTVWIDEAHLNIVATTGRYEPFVAALEADGFVVRPLRARLTAEALHEVQILVVGNALHPGHLEHWSIVESGGHPTAASPRLSAFSDVEIDALHAWVSAGGRLLLMADHMPFAGAAARLADRFGFTFLDGFVEDPATWDPATFRRSDGTLRDHPITRGLDARRDVPFVATFDGQAFRSETAQPLMVLGSQYVSYQPAIVWDIDEQTPQVSVSGWLQGAVDRIRAGRIAVFGDATMFSAQVTRDGHAMGMNSDEGMHNLQFLLNVMRWLTEPGEPH